MLLLELVEQHRRQELVVDRLDGAVRRMRDEARSRLRDFFGDEAVLQRALRIPIVFVVERDGAQPHEHVARGPIEAMSSFTVRDKLAVPSCPALSISTGTPVALPVVTPPMPAMNVRVWTLPSRIVVASPATPMWPMAMLPEPVVQLDPARPPSAVLFVPVVLVNSARSPMAVLRPPVVSLSSASVPTAVLAPPIDETASRRCQPPCCAR